ncbi:hypothetical protein L6164_013644 [Bauhinia variegata]|uniref:Uncharacterized protein n=1 Tax=Bauhinia variegata TaxID=167791 RepID=A0ACB9NF45_BAUVA|nr:hypothetical protein L6164_013644 [Bauhinia variegata]
MWNLWRNPWASMPVMSPMPVRYPSLVSLPCAINISKSSSGNRFGGGPFTEVLKIVYTNFHGCGTCTLELHQKGVADRVEEVRVKLLDKANAYDVVDAEIVAIRDATTEGISCWMTVRRSNFHTRRGVRHFWGFDEHWNTEGIPYLSVPRFGMFAFDEQIVDDPRFDKVDIRHKYTSEDSDGGVRFRVKVRIDPGHPNGLVVKIHGPDPHDFFSLYKDIDFLIRCPIARPSGGRGSGGGQGGGGDGGNVAQVGAANPSPQSQPQPQPAGSYSNSGQQDMKGLINASGYTNGVGNNAVNINNYSNCNFGRQDSKKN